MTKILELGLVLLMAGVGWPSGVSPADDAESQIPVHEMEGITVTATRVPTPLSEVPVATEVVTSEDIEESGASDVKELLQRSVGVEVRDHGYMGSVSSMSIRGSAANQVLVLVDGRPVNSVSLGTADLTEIGLEDVRRVEIVRGPISSLYGANALGGVVNVVTGARDEEPGITGRAEFGSHGKEVYSGRASSSWKGFGFNLTLQKRMSDGERHNSDYDGERLSAKMTYTSAEGLEADLTGALEGFELGLPGPVPQAGVTPTYGSEEVTSCYDRQKNYKAYLDFSLASKLRNGLDGSLKLFFDRRDMDTYSVYEGFDFISFTTYKAVETDEYVTTRLGAQVQLDARLLPRTRMVFGLDAGLSDLNAGQMILNDSTGELTQTRWFPVDTTAGLYAETDWHPWGGVTVVGSARYDWSEAYGNRVSPGLGLVYALDRNARVKLSFGQAFRAPTLNDLYWPQSAFAGGNPDVKPEEGVGGELRAEYEPAQFVGVRASVFAREVQDLIQWSPDKDGFWRPANVNNFSSRGVELELELLPVADARVKGHVSYISSVQKSEETVAYDEYLMPVYGLVERRAAFRPDLEGSIRASYMAPFGFEFRIGLDYAGERVSYWQEVDTTGGSWKPITREKWLDDRFLADAGVGFYLGPQYFFARVENIFDRHYSEQFGYGLLDRDYPGPGRTFSYGMKLTLD